MADNTRELDQIQDNLQTLHARSQTNRAHLQKHEAVCEERYDQILSTLELVQSDMEKMHTKLDCLNNLAVKGKSSLRTLVFVGTVVSGLIGAWYYITNFLPK